MKYSESNWKSCLESLGFIEQKNNQFGGMVIYDNRLIPMWTYETEEEKQRLYIFFSGAVYWKVHMTLN